VDPAARFEKTSRFAWHGDINACHVAAVNDTGRDDSFLCVQDNPAVSRTVRLKPGESWRFIASKKSSKDAGIEIRHSERMHITFREVLDRAYFPTG
jgi:hypothetical protein